MTYYDLEYKDKKIIIPDAWIFVLLNGLELARNNLPPKAGIPQDWERGDVSDFNDLIKFIRMVNDEIEEKLSSGN